jgi:hypothetical protein
MIYQNVVRKGRKKLGIFGYKSRNFKAVQDCFKVDFEYTDICVCLCVSVSVCGGGH